jgi:hypothetical protein
VLDSQVCDIDTVMTVFAQQGNSSITMLGGERKEWQRNSWYARNFSVIINELNQSCANEYE